MDDVLLMHVGQPLQDLLHVVHTGSFCVLKVVVHNAFKQFPTCNTTARRTNSYYVSLTMFSHLGFS